MMPLQTKLIMKERSNERNRNAFHQPNGAGDLFQSPEYHRAASMTPPLEKNEKRLREWQEAMVVVEEVISDLMRIVGQEPEAPLHSTVSALQGLVTRQVAEIISTSEDWLEISTSEDWLEAWWIEYSFGEKPMKVRLPGEDWREIKSIEELAQVIYDDLNLSEKEKS